MRKISEIKNRPKTKKGEATRLRLLKAAEELFGEKDYFETSVAEITQRAQVALGTFYLYFPGKVEIFRELVQQLNHDLRAEIRNSVSHLSIRKDIEKAGLQTFFSFVSKHRNLYRVVQQAELVDQELYRWYYRKLAEGYASGLSEAAKKGQIRKLDPECLAYCLMGIGHFLGMRWVLWEGKSVPEDEWKTAVEFIYHGILKSDHS